MGTNLSTIDRSTYGNLVEPDVPLLMGDLAGLNVLVYEKAGIIRAYFDEGVFFFCLAENYDKALSFVYGQRGEYGFYTYDYQTYEEKLRALTAEEKSAIDEIITLGNYKAVPYETSINTMLDIYRADEELLLEQHMYAVGSIEQNGKTDYYVLTYADDAILAYPIPEEYISVFENLIVQAES